MNFHKALAILQQSEKFQQPENSFLSYAMYQGDWSFGYFQKDKEKFTTFFMKDNDIINITEDDAINNPDSEILELETDKIILENPETAIKEALEKYQNPPIQKTIIILQNIKDLGTHYNVTVMTKTMLVINLKINTETGKLLHHSSNNLMDLARFTPGKQ